jgi:hypothetical protein
MIIISFHLVISFNLKAILSFFEKKGEFGRVLNVLGEFRHLSYILAVQGSVSYPKHRICLV